MKKKQQLQPALLLLLVGGVTALNVINPSWRENTILRLQETSNSPILKHEKEL